MASTIRGETKIPGKIAAVRETQRGDWYEIKPDDKSVPAFTTRASKIELR